MAAYNRQSMLGCLFVGDLHPNVCETLLYNTLIPYGFISSVRVFRDNVTGCSRGFGHVTFAHPADAEKAMDNLMFKPLFGKPIRIMWYQPNPTLRQNGIGNLYISGLAKNIDSCALYDTFSNFGEILSCKVASDQYGSKGYGFVHFKTMEAAETARKILDGKLLNDVQVSITHYKTLAERRTNKAEPKSFPPSLYVSNLPYYFTSEQLGILFSQFGTVLSANVMTKNGRSKGFGFVALDNFEATTKALAAMNGQSVGKRILSVALSNSAHKSRERKEQGCKNDNIHVKREVQQQPACALPPGKFGVMHSSSPVNLLSRIQPSTLQDVKSLLLPGQKLQQVISATRLELCKTDILKMPVKLVSCPALHTEKFVETVPNSNTATVKQLVRSNTQQRAVSVYRGDRFSITIPVSTLEAIRSAMAALTSGRTSQLVHLQSSTPQNVLSLYQRDCVQVTIHPDLLVNIRSWICGVQTSSSTSNGRVLHANLPALTYSHAQQESVDPNVNTTQQDVVTAVCPDTNTDLSLRRYSMALKDAADHYSESYLTEKDAKMSKTSFWKMMKSGITSVVQSPLTWSIIGLYTVTRR